MCPRTHQNPLTSETNGELMVLPFRVQTFVSACLISLGPKVPKRGGPLEPTWETAMNFAAWNPTS